MPKERAGNAETPRELNRYIWLPVPPRKDQVQKSGGHARDGAIIFADLVGKLDALYVHCPKCSLSRTALNRGTRT
jgi:hypothetical protein